MDPAPSLDRPGGRRLALGAGLVLASIASGVALDPLLRSVGPFGAIVAHATLAGAMLALATALMRSRRRLRTAREDAATLARGRDTLIQEMQHRVANNIQFVTTLLTLQKRQLRDPDGRAALDDAQRRLGIMARIHRRLHDPRIGDAALGRVVEEVCGDLLEATDASPIACAVEMVPVDWPVERRMTLVLLVTELVTNALKHAFPEGRAGTIRVELARRSPQAVMLTVTDDGVGLPEGFSGPAAASLGMRIVHSLGGQLGGELTFRGRPGREGTQVELTMPG